MPVVRAAASKYLAQKWQEDSFRTHRLRVTNACSMLDMHQPRQFPHLQLAVNKLALEEDKQNKYDRENQLLLKKIGQIVKGHGTLDQWNQWTRKELHAQARERQQRKIEKENEAMLKRLKAAKPCVRKDLQMKDYQKHRHYQGMLESGVKDYPSPRGKKPNGSSEASGSEVASPRQSKPASEHLDDKQSASPSSGSAEENKEEVVVSLPPIPKKSKKKAPASKKKIKQPKQESTSELKLPSIDRNQKTSSGGGDE